MEKATQVRNMLMIYQKATKVVTWLGASDEYLDDVSCASASIVGKTTFDKDFEFERIHAGIQSLYMRPWFHRIWVQQEIFAARELRLQCGHREFTWPTLLSRPKLLSTLPQLQRYNYPDRTRATQKGHTGKPPKEITVQLNAISRLVGLHTMRLSCFEQFHKRSDRQLDLVDTLLDTGVLHATDIRDHIYGILGITGFSAKPMSIANWNFNRQSEVCIPIDYTAEWSAILCAVTWAAVMKGGLALIAKFKVFDKDASESTLPSWVIDWRMTAKLTRRYSPQSKNGEGLTIKLDNPWDMRILDPHKGSKNPGKSVRIPAPAAHERLVEYNKMVYHHFTKLILRGAIDSRFYTDDDDNVWGRRSLLKDKRLWLLPFKAEYQDIFVFMTDFRGISHKSSMLGVRLDDNDDTAPRYTSGGLWLLRPVANDEFKLLACLSWVPSDWRPLYDHWEWLVPQSTMESSNYRRLYQDLGESFIDYSPPMHKGKLIGLHKCVIV
jgi:hypothetical protein